MACLADGVKLDSQVESEMDHEKTPSKLSAERSTNTFRKKRNTLAFWKADIPKNGESIPTARQARE
jgi:hypothetical protein